MKFKILYHVTPGKNIKNIIKRGLRINQESHIPQLAMYDPKTRSVKSRKSPVLYFTDKKGVQVIINGYVQCSKKPFVLKVKVPVDWLEYIEPESMEYIVNPVMRAWEWVSERSIPVKYILAIYEVEC